MKKDLEALRHSASHILAQAVLELFPKTKLAIGPAIETGFYYDFDRTEPFTPEDLKKIEEKMNEIVKRNLKIEKSEVTKVKAKELLKNQPYKLELLEELKGKITFYKQGNFIDLCAGPHVDSTSEVKAIKLLNVAGAYWRGDSKNKMLQRIYGTAFYEKSELKEYLTMLEEAEKRDHKKLGKELGIFMTHEYSLPGSPFFLSHGTTIYNELLKLVREEYVKRGYQEVITPQLYKKALWETSGHWEHYKDDMFTMKIGNDEYSLKPMNCPSHVLIYKNKLRSYKDLPIRIADFCYLHRNELGGVLGGLTRVTKFAQDDAHIFISEDQIEQEIDDLFDFIDYLYNKVFKFKYTVKLSTRPEKFMGDKKLWDEAEKTLKKVLKDKKIDFVVKEGEGAFYGPKIDFDINDAIGRPWQCATIQLDFQLPQRFEATYEGKDGAKHPVIMIHRALLGSLERFIGILIENYAGKFPLWLSPVQVKIVTVNDNCIKFAQELQEKLKQNEIRVELDSRSESIGRKVRDSQLEKVNYIITIGEKEIESKKLAIRTREGKVTFGVAVDTFIKELKEEINKKC